GLWHLIAAEPDRTRRRADRQARSADTVPLVLLELQGERQHGPTLEANSFLRLKDCRVVLAELGVNGPGLRLEWLEVHHRRNRESLLLEGGYRVDQLHALGMTRPLERSGGQGDSAECEIAVLRSARAAAGEGFVGQCLEADGGDARALRVGH